MGRPPGDIKKTISAMKKAVFVILISSLFTGRAISQERLKPGAIYQAGDEIYAPMVGYRGVIPDGWFGTLPQGEEVFLLLPAGNKEGYMFINANEIPLSQLEEQWHEKLQVTDEISISLKGKPLVKDNRMMGDFTASGTREPFKGYAVAIDGGHGWTITLALLAPVDVFVNYKKNFDQLVASSELSEPAIGTVYGDFDWAEFLNNKYLMSIAVDGRYKEQNEIWLCADGTFKSKIKSKGFGTAGKSPYRGKKKGTWTAEGIGEKGKLKLNFDKVGPAKLDLEIKDDKIFINGGRFFALQYDDCKSKK